MELKYNYVVFGSSIEYSRIVYADLEKCNNVVKYVTEKSLLKRKQLLFKIHFSRKINKIIRLPLKKIWLKTFDVYSPSDEKPICFFFMAYWNNIEYQLPFIEFLKNKYPNSRTVLFLQDIFKLYEMPYTSNPFDAEELKSRYDMVMTYDKGDADRYGLFYHPTPFSYYDVGNVSDVPESDVFFIGKAKDRLPMIYETFDKLTSLGLNCLFVLHGVKKRDKIDKKGIVYINKLLPYKECLQYVSRTKCILEIMQGGAKGSTLRVWEAMVYNKHLLTNDTSLVNSRFYRKEGMMIYNSVNDLDESIKLRIMSSDILNYNCREELSPIKLLEFVDKKLR